MFAVELYQTILFLQDNQVPVCPLCNSLVPVKKGETPDITVGRHIDNDCKSDTAQQRRKVSYISQMIKLLFELTFSNGDKSLYKIGIRHQIY